MVACLGSIKHSLGPRGCARSNLSIIPAKRHKRISKITTRFNGLQVVDCRWLARHVGRRGPSVRILPRSHVNRPDPRHGEERLRFDGGLASRTWFRVRSKGRYAAGYPAAPRPFCLARHRIRTVLDVFQASRFKLSDQSGKPVSLTR